MLWQLWGRIYSGRAGSICIVRNLPDASVLIWKAREIVGNQSERETRGSSTAVRDSDRGV